MNDSQMIMTNFHTHCYLDDGTGKPEEYVEAAIRNGLRALGFSCHAPLPFAQDWVLPKSDLPVYVREVSALKKKYAGQIEIYLGLEVDYLRGVLGTSSPSIASLRLDFTVGSVHFLNTTVDDDQLTIDGPEEDYRRLLEEGFGGDIKRMVREYYQLVREMVSEHTPDIVGHFDVIKKNNPGGKYFNEEDVWYRDEVMKTLDNVAAAGSILEVNTGGLARERTDSTYPPLWVIKECRKLGIPTNVNSDTHAPDQLTHYFPEAHDLLREAGYQEKMILLGGRWQMVPI
jgi:histidinol-phosphatase (PHP family)